MNKKVLIVEDQENIREVCTRYLQREGYEVFTGKDGEEGWQLFNQSSPHLVILDLMMPKKDGWQLCEEIRSQSDIPIIILTARGEEHDRILGLTLGADDYLTKPFSPRELVLRVQIILRRTSQQQIQEQNSWIDRMIFQDLEINPTTRTVFLQEEKINLTAKEFDLLCLLARHPYQVFSRMQLLDLLWDSQHQGDVNAVTVLVSRLRDKLSRPSQTHRFIHTVWGIGYRFHPQNGKKA